MGWTTLSLRHESLISILTIRLTYPANQNTLQFHGRNRRANGTYLRCGLPRCRTISKKNHISQNLNPHFFSGGKLFDVERIRKQSDSGTAEFERTSREAVVRRRREFPSAAIFYTRRTIAREQLKEREMEEKVP